MQEAVEEAAGEEDSVDSEEEVCQAWDNPTSGKNSPCSFSILQNNKSVYNITSVSLFLIGMLTGLNFWLINIPYFTLYKFHIWTIFTSFYSNTSLIGVNFLLTQIVINILISFFLCNTWERKLGTGRLILDITIKNMVLQSAIAIFGAIILYSVFGIFQVLVFGIWPTYFVYLTMRCMKNPNGVTNCCTMPIPNKYYPLLLILIFSLMGSVAWGAIGGYLLGLVLVKWPKLDEKLQPKASHVAWIENKLKRFEGKIGSIFENNFRNCPWRRQADNHLFRSSAQWRTETSSRWKYDARIFF